MKSRIFAVVGAPFFIATIHAQVVQTEPNDSIGTATPTNLTAGSSGGIFSNGNNGDGPHGPTTGDSSGDFDFFSVEADAGQTIVFDTNSNILGTGVDTLIGIYNSAGILVASNDDDGTSRDSFIRFIIPVAGTYYPVVGNWVQGSADDAGSLPTDPNTPGTGRGAPGGAVDDYEAVILLDGPVYFSHNTPAFPLIGPDEQSVDSCTLTNQGSATATITALNLTGPGASAYILNQAVPLTVAAGADASIQITFDPAGSADSQEATLEIVSDDLIHPTLSISLSERAIDGLLFRLPFDDPPGSPLSSFGTPEETSGNGFTAAIVVNAGSPNPVFGRPPVAGDEGTSVMFNDAGSSGNFALTPNGFPHTASFSYSLWVRPTAGSGIDTLFNRDPGFGQGDVIYGCSINTDGTVFFRIAGGEVVASAPGAVPDDSAHHIVVTHLDSTGFGDFLADRTRLFIDGELVSENTTTTEVPEYQGGGTNTRLWIATRSAAGTGFNGDMDDFQLYNTELDPLEVADLFDNPGTVVGEAPRAPFAITEIVRAPDGDSVTITWNSRPGRDYALDSSPDMKVWVELNDSIPSDGESTSVAESNSVTPATSEIYFRVRESG